MHQIYFMKIYFEKGTDPLMICTNIRHEIPSNTYYQSKGKFICPIFRPP